MGGMGGRDGKEGERKRREGGSKGGRERVSRPTEDRREGLQECVYTM